MSQYSLPLSYPHVWGPLDFITQLPLNEIDSYQPFPTHQILDSFNPLPDDKFKTLPNWKSLQTTISNLMKMAESYPNGLKTLREKEKLLVTSNFSFSHSVFKRLVSQGHQIVLLCGNGLNWKSLQTWCKWQKVCQMGRKLCGKRRNSSLWAISLFPTVFSKHLYWRHMKNRACVGIVM